MKKAASIFFCSVAWAFGIQAQEIEKPAAERVAVLQDKRINESSGLTRSLKHSGVFWTLNDSSSAPCVFAIDEKGQTRAKVRIPGAVNFDWEDLACAKDAQGIPHLFIGDLGDNLSVRPTVTVYEVSEPDLPQNADKEQLSAAPKLWHATYPDGRHNAETLLVHPKTRRIYIVTKTEHGHSALYAFPEKPAQGATLELVKLIDLEFPPRHRLGKRPQDACQTTGGAFSPDGTRIAISTYSYIHEWRFSVGTPPEEALKKQSRLIEPPLAMQMEALSYGEDSATIWFTSERLPAPLWKLSR